eukprot:504051_1
MFDKVKKKQVIYMSSKIIVDYLNSFDALSEQHFFDNVIYSIQRLGRAAFLSILQNGLQCIGKDADHVNTLSTVSSITEHVKARNRLQTSVIHLTDLFDMFTMKNLSPFLSICDQITLKQSCHHFYHHIGSIDVQRHNWIELPHNIHMNQLIVRFDRIQLRNKTFEKVKMCGETQYDFTDAMNTNNTFFAKFSDTRSVEESVKRKDAFCKQMGTWLFILRNICGNTATFISPKLNIKSGLGSFIYQMNNFLKEKRVIYEDIRYAKDTKNLPRKLVFQCNDGESIDDNGIAFFLESVESSFEDIKSLLNNNKVKVYVTRKYGIFDRTLCDKMLKKSGITFGEAFADPKHKFVTLRRRNNKFYTIYLRFTKRLMEKYTRIVWSDDEDQEQ